VPVPPEPPVDLGFLNSPVETDEQRRAYLAGAIHYAQRTCALADEVLGRPGQPKSMGPELKRFAPLIAAAAAGACAHVAELLGDWSGSPSEPSTAPHQGTPSESSGRPRRHLS